MMRCRVVLLVLMASLCLLAGPAAADWLVISEGKEDGHFMAIDRSTVRTTPAGRPEGEFLLSYDTQQKTLPQGVASPQPYQSLTTLIEADCVAHRVRFLNALVYAGPQEQGSVVYREPARASEPFRSAQPGTIGHIMHNALCTLQRDPEASLIPDLPQPLATPGNWLPIGVSKADQREISVDRSTITTSPEGRVSGWFLLNFDTAQHMPASGTDEAFTYLSSAMRVEADCHSQSLRFIQHRVYSERDEQGTLQQEHVNPPGQRFQPIEPGTAGHIMTTTLCAGQPVPPARKSAVSANWTLISVYNDNGNEIYADRNTISAASGNQATGWFLINYSSPQRLSGSNEQGMDSYLSMAVRVEANCNTYALRMIQGRLYAGRGEQGARLSDYASPADTPFKASTPGSGGRVFAQQLCSNQPGGLPSGDLPAGTAGDSPP